MGRPSGAGLAIVLVCLIALVIIGAVVAIGGYFVITYL